MKKVLVVVFSLATVIAQGMTICRNDNADTQKQTSIVIDKGLLSMVCVRDVSPEAQTMPRKTTAEICAKDLYNLKDGGHVTINGQQTHNERIFSSVFSAVTSVFTINMSGDNTTATVTVQPSYNAVTVQGNNKVEIAAGTMTMNCAEVQPKK